tara:strand:+ start:5034 stop:5825 length:792 start_codon:yes stop_codon:yes gene_type:complete
MKSSELVSVIIPIYNAFHTVGFTIDSVLSQTYRNLEVIIIDDSSSNEGIDKLEKYYEGDHRINIIRLENNLGVWNARNVGIKSSKGRYIAFCDADDLWHAKKLEKQIALMVKEEADIVFSSYDIVDADGNKIGQDLISKTKIQYTDMLYYNHIGNLTAILDSEQIGKPEQQNIHHEDYAMWLKLMRIGPTVIGITEPLAAYRVHSSNLTKNKVRSLVWHYNVLKNSENINTFNSIYYTLIGRLRLFYKKVIRRKYPNQPCNTS